MRLPFVAREDMDIHRRGEELYVRVGTYKRNLVLPQSLQRLEVRGANFVGDQLEIVVREGARLGRLRDGEERAWLRPRGPRKRDGHDRLPKCRVRTLPTTDGPSAPSPSVPSAWP